MKLPIKNLIFLVLSCCIMHITAMDPEEANKRLFFLAIAGTNDSTIPLGSSPSSLQVHALNKMAKSISPEGSSDNITPSTSRKMDYSQFHKLFQNALQIVGEANDHVNYENTITDILKTHIRAEQKELNKEELGVKKIKEVEFEIKATKLALYMCQLQATDEKTQS